MVYTFRAKVRCIGTSAGILIPQESLQQDNIRIGDEIDIAIVPHKDFSGFGMGKHAKVPFKRDKATRHFT